MKAQVARAVGRFVGLFVMGIAGFCASLFGFPGAGYVLVAGASILAFFNPE